MPQLGQKAIELTLGGNAKSRVGPLPIGGNAARLDIQVERDPLRRQTDQYPGADVEFTRRHSTLQSGEPVAKHLQSHVRR